MGKKEKHRQGQSRNNPVFKVANGRFSKTKGKAKEVTSKLKKLQMQQTKTSKAIANADIAFKALQKNSVSMKGKPVSVSSKTKIEPSNLLNKEDCQKVNVDALAEIMETTSTSTKT